MDILYHYCSAHAFYSIINNKEIWLSSLSLSNDYKEGIILFDKMKSKVNNADVILSNKDSILTTIDRVSCEYDALAFCLSKKKDMLSQWRGYADDGRGFSIGFAKDDIIKLLQNDEVSGLDLKLREVIYDPEKIDETADQVLSKIKDAINMRADYAKYGVDLFYLMLGIFIEISIHDSFLLKNQSFKEEDEWRLTYIKKHNKIDDRSTYRVNIDRIIPYISLSLNKLEKCIYEVYIGPKNITPPQIVEAFLLSKKFRNAKVYKSSASYR